MIHHCKALMLYFSNLQKIATFENIEFFGKIQLYSKIVCKNMSKKMIRYTFWKDLDHAVLKMQTKSQNLKIS